MRRPTAPRQVPPDARPASGPSAQGLTRPAAAGRPPAAAPASSGRRSGGGSRSRRGSCVDGGRWVVLERLVAGVDPLAVEDQELTRGAEGDRSAVKHRAAYVAELRDDQPDGLPTGSGQIGPGRQRTQVAV